MCKNVFSKVARIPLQVYHFNKNGTSFQAFFNEFSILSTLWLLQQQVMRYERTLFYEKKENNCRVIEKHFK